MAGLKLFSVGPPYEWLDQQLNFNMLRDCGADVEGFIMSFASAYLEALILAQNTSSSNFIFLEHL
jgi:hypothetical protein